MFKFEAFEFSCVKRLMRRSLLAGSYLVDQFELEIGDDGSTVTGTGPAVVV